MDRWPEIADLLAAQHGVVSTAQLKQHELSPRTLGRWTRERRLEKCAPGVLRLVGAPVTWQQRLKRGLLSLGASAAVSHAASETLRVNVPSVSSVSLKSVTPSYGSVPSVGLNPTTPQYDAGRMIEPLVCVPSAPHTCAAATAAADPDDDPPGVCPARHGLRVFPGCMNASSVVTVLPKT